MTFSNLCYVNLQSTTKSTTNATAAITTALILQLQPSIITIQLAGFSCIH